MRGMDDLLAAHIALHGEYLTEQNGEAWVERQTLLGHPAPASPDTPAKDSEGQPETGAADPAATQPDTADSVPEPVLGTYDPTVK